MSASEDEKYLQKNGSTHKIPNGDYDADVMVAIVDSKTPSLMGSCRMAVGFIFFLGFLNLYSLRINLSVAMVCMLNRTAIAQDQEALAFSANKTGNALKDEYNSMCSAFTNLTQSNSTDVTKEGEFNWNKNIQGLVLGSFFWGYMITQIPGGWLAGKFGGKTVFGWCMLVCGLVTLLMPVAARIHFSLVLILRFVCGLCQGVGFPAMHGLWSQWAPPLERSTLLGLTMAGTQIGNVVALPISGALCDVELDGGWPWIFYLFGLIAIVWFFAWHFYVTDTPAQHKTITAVEREYILKSLQGVSGKKDDVIPWLAFFKSVPFWGLMVTHTCSMFGIYLFLTNMPTYMKEVLKFDVKLIGVLSAVPYIFFWALINISAVLADWFRRKKLMSTTATRKLFNTLGNIVPAIFMVALGHTDCRSQPLAIVFLVIALSFMGCVFGSGWAVNPADLAPRYAGILFGISNTVATMPGFIGPSVVSALTKNQTAVEWRHVYYLASAVFTVGSIFYLIFGSGELQPWANPAPKKEELKMLDYTPEDIKSDIEEHKNSVTA